MVPAGEITESTVKEIGAALEEGDAIIDGGNSYYRDDIRRAAELGERGIDYVDCGTSGGVFGLERGYCLMIGGPDRRRRRGSTRSSPRWRRGSIRPSAPRAAPARPRRPRTATCTAARTAPATS